MAVMTAGQVAALVMSVGWTTESDIKTAVAIAYDESRFDTKAVGGPNSNGSKDFGLFQVNSVHKPTSDEKTQPLANTKKAYAIYKQQGWKAWATYNKGLSGAAKKQGQIGFDKVKANPDYADKVVEQEQTPTVQDDFTQGVGIPGAIKNGISAVTKTIETFALNTLAVTAALVFIILGIVILLRGPIGSVATKATPIGKAAKLAKAVG